MTEYDKIYVVMRETWDGHRCDGYDLFMSLDCSRALMYLHTQAPKETLSWDEAADMYVYRSRYSWEKIYMEERALDEEL